MIPDARAAPQKYFTYQPKPVSAAPLGQGSLANQPMTPANTLKLLPGQTAKFAAGKGWYAEDAIPKVPGPSKAPVTVGGTTPGGGTTPPVGKPDTTTPAAAPYDMDRAIADDWETISAGGEANLMNTNALSNFQKQLRQAYIDYGGGDNTNLGEWAQYIDEPTQQAARANKFSTLALDQRNFESQNAQAMAELAARGMLGSGDQVEQGRQLLFNKEQADYGGLRNFQGGAVGSFQTLNDIAQQARDRITAARGNAAKRAADAAPVDNSAYVAAGGTAVPGNAGLTPTDTPPGTTVPASTGKYTWDTTVTNLAQLNAWLKARGKTLAAFKTSNPAAYAKLAAQ